MNRKWGQRRRRGIMNEWGEREVRGGRKEEMEEKGIWGKT